MPEFRTIEISDPSYERDGLRMITVKSRALKRRADITLFLPAGAAGILPLVVLLHGVYGSHWAWALSGGAHITAQSMIDAGQIRPIALAMPSDGLWGDGSGYVQHTTGEDYEGWIMEEVPSACALAAPGLIDANAKGLLSGLSMGGYGALRLGAKHSPRVKAISAHSSVTHARRLTNFTEEGLGEFGPLDSPELDPFYWMQQNRTILPSLRFDCGTEDDLLTHNRALHHQLTEAGIPHEYEEFPGAHNWTYWREHLQDTLRFFEKALST